MYPNRNQKQISELSVQVGHLRKDIAELKGQYKELSDRHNLLENRTTVLEEKQNHDQQEFSDRKYVEKELKASLQQICEQFQQEMKEIKSELEPMRSLSQAITNTPGGLKTWISAGTISLFLSLTAIDSGVRAIRVDHLLRHWLIQQTNIEKVITDTNGRSPVEK